MLYTKQTLIMTILQLILSSKIREELTPKDWVRMLLVADSKGCLFYGFDVSGRLSKLAIAFRIKEINEDVELKFPEKEEGNILWVSDFVSVDKSSIRDEIKNIFGIFKDIEEIAFEDPHQKIVRIPRRVYHGEEKISQS